MSASGASAIGESLGKMHRFFHKAFRTVTNW
jgi:hypothetical protein